MVDVQVRALVSHSFKQLVLVPEGLSSLSLPFFKQMNSKKNKKIMTTKININGKEVEITLTKQQVEQIKKYEQKITDRIKSYEDACEDLGLDPVEDLPFQNPKNNRQEAANAFHMLDVITESLLEGKKLDWEDADQRKWYPVFNNYSSGSGFRFLYSFGAWTNSGATGGARLCVDTQEKSDYLGTQFLAIWNKFLNPIK